MEMFTRFSTEGFEVKGRLVGYNTHNVTITALLQISLAFYYYI